MKGPPLLVWLLVFLYALWAFALQGVLASPSWMGAFAPELGIVLLASFGGRLGAGRAQAAAVIVALARASLGADPPLALAAGYLGVTLLASLLRAGLEVDRPLARAALAGASAWLLGGFLVAARSAALAGSASSVSVEGVPLWSLAASTAAACLLLAPFCSNLPGLSRLWRRRV